MATPFIPFTLAWLIGIWLASRIALPTVALGVAAVVAVVGIILTWRVPRPRWMFILALAAMLGALRYNLAQPHFDQTSLATYNDQQKPVIVEGLVVSEPDARDVYTNLARRGGPVSSSPISQRDANRERARACPSAAVHRFPLWRPHPRRRQTPDADRFRRFLLS